MAIFKKTEEFIPRKLPLKMPRKKEEVKIPGGRKWILAFFLGTIILSLGFWVWGNKPQIWQKPFSPAVITFRPTPTPQPQTSEIENEIIQLTKSLKGSYGVYVYNLTGKWEYGVNQNETFPAASLIKLPVFLSLYQEVEAGRIDLETKYTLKNSDKQKGAGNMQYKPAGTVFTYRQMAELMGKQSDNTAFYVFQRILSDAKIQATIDNLGMTKTSLKENETSPADIGLFFRKLYAGSIVSREHREEILDYLTETFEETRIPAGVPEGTRVAHKIGTEIGSISDAGIVFSQKPFILVIISKNVLEKEAQEILPKITKAVWEFETE